MKILIVSATHFESEKLTTYRSDRHQINILVTGIGMVNSAYRLTKSLWREKIDLVLNIGICGSYDPALSIGQVVHVQEEIFADMGATDAEGVFLNLQTMGFRQFSHEGKNYYNSISNPNKPDDFFDQSKSKIPSVKGLTVNTASGDPARIERLRDGFKPHIENMEGAAIAAVCVQENIPYFEFRSISNYVEPRDPSKWNLPLACSAIQNFTLELLAKIKSGK